jgi:hypothetical protein
VQFKKIRENFYSYSFGDYRIIMQNKTISLSMRSQTPDRLNHLSKFTKW